MKKVFTALLLLGALLTNGTLFSAYTLIEVSILPVQTGWEGDPDLGVKQAAFEVLQLKCNVCHRKQNPFKVFSLKNMNRHAQKIFHQVFTLRRMPKGQEIQLTEEEYQMLSNWLTSENIK